MSNRLDDFQKTRADINEEILNCGHLGIKRFFALDHQAYEPGPLATKTKELLGLRRVHRSPLRRLHHLPSRSQRGRRLDQRRSH